MTEEEYLEYYTPPKKRKDKGYLQIVKEMNLADQERGRLSINEAVKSLKESLNHGKCT